MGRAGRNGGRCPEAADSDNDRGMSRRPAIYEHDPGSAPDEEFEQGSLSHAVVGNEGRMLDPRRTPVRVVDVRPATGLVVLEVAGFEDAGTRWEIELERLGGFQFARGSAHVEGAPLAELEQVVRRLDRTLEIPADADARERTARRLSAGRLEARRWLRQRPVHVDLGRRRSETTTWRLISEFLQERGLAETEQAFAERYVSNPGAGELVKGHRIVLAELGLAPYAGKIVRDPGLFAGAWSRERRADHLLARLAFVPELFRAAGHETVTLWRGLSSERPLEPRRHPTFVSATFSREVAEAHFTGTERTTVSVLSRQVAPVERLFMTYIETEAMNRRFLEAEAVLLDDGNTWVP
jgi:hypothetical protein